MPRRGRDNWDTLVGDLYRSTLDLDAAAALPARFAALTGGTVASLWRLDPRTIAPVEQPLTNAPPEALEAYSTHYHRQDPWADAVHTARFGTVLHGADIVDDDALARSSYYNEFAAQYDMFHMLGTLVPLGPGTGGQVGVLSILRPRSAGAFDGRVAARLQRLLPHLRNTLELQGEVDQRLGALRAEALEAALDVLGVPAAVLDGDGAIVCCNAAAESFIREALLPRRTVNAMALTLDAAARDRMARLLAAAARGEAGGQVCLPHPARPAMATLTPLPAGLAQLAGARHGRVLLVLRPFVRKGADTLAKPAMAVFGFTAAEAQAAASLAGGQSPGEIAATRAIKVSTVRTLLARAQHKAGARNLRDLVGILSLLR